MTLTRDAVVDAAVDLLGEVGLEGLSLRRLARDLGVSAPTLYWHVADKRTLLDHVAERLLADQWQVTPPAPGEDWADWLRERAVVQYRALVAHRDAARVVAGNRPTEASMPAVEVVLGTLIDAGLIPRRRLLDRPGDRQPRHRLGDRVPRRARAAAVRPRTPGAPRPRGLPAPRRAPAGARGAHGHPRRPRGPVPPRARPDDRRPARVPRGALTARQSSRRRYSSPGMDGFSARACSASASCAAARSRCSASGSESSPDSDVAVPAAALGARDGGGGVGVRGLLVRALARHGLGE